MKAKIENNKVVEFPYSEYQLRSDQSDISFPGVIENDTLEEYGLFEVEEIIPETSDTQKIIYSQMPELIDGKWVLKHSVVNKTTEELEAEIRALVPKTITLRQAREIVIRSGLFNAIETHINSIEDETERLIARNYWEYSEVFDRNHPVLLQLVEPLGISSEQLDGMFIEASSM